MKRVLDPITDVSTILGIASISFATAIYSFTLWVFRRTVIRDRDEVIRLYSGVIDRRPSSGRFTRTGWILRSFELLFAALNCLSISQHVRGWTRRDYFLASTHVGTRLQIDRAEARRVDTYVSISTLVILGMLITGAPGEFISVALPAYFIAESTQRTGSTVIFDKLRGHLPPADTRRSLILSIVNLFQVIIGFALIWSVADSACLEPSKLEVIDYVLHSFEVAGFGNPACSTQHLNPNAIVSAIQRLATLWILTVVISNAVSALPRRD